MLVSFPGCNIKMCPSFKHLAIICCSTLFSFLQCTNITVSKTAPRQDAAITMPDSWQTGLTFNSLSVSHGALKAASWLHQTFLGSFRWNKKRLSLHLGCSHGHLQISVKVWNASLFFGQLGHSWKKTDLHFILFPWELLFARITVSLSETQTARENILKRV